MNESIKIEKTVSLEINDQELEFEVEVYGVREEGGSHAEFTENGWLVDSWDYLGSKDLSMKTLFLIEEKVKEKDWSSDFKAKIQDMKEAAAERRAGL